VAINQLNPVVVDATMKSFQAHAIEIQGNHIFGPCGESALTMNMNCLGKIYRFKLYRRAVNTFGYSGYALTFDDIVTFTGLDYLVVVSVRMTDTGFNPVRAVPITHAILILNVDPAANTVTYITTQLDWTTTTDQAVRPRMETIDHFLMAWTVSDITGTVFVLFH